MTVFLNDPSDYEMLFHLSLEMLCIAGLDGYFKQVNPAFSQVLGFSREELLSKPFMDFIHPDDKESTAKEVSKLEQGERTLNFENRYLCADGSYRVLSWSSVLEPVKGLLYAAARDITEQKDTELKLSQIHNALNFKAIIAKTDTKGVITEVNDKFCEISGYTREELIGNTHKLINSGAHTKAFFRGMWKTISSGEVWSGMIENRRKNGEHYFVHTIITPVTDIQGNVISYLAIRFDTTPYVHLKNQLKRTLGILNETGEIAKVGGWELEVETGDLNWTDETFNILEVEKKEGQRPVLPDGLDLFTPQSKPIIENAVNRAIQYGEPYSLELQALTAKGNVRWVYTNGKANYKDGKVVTLSGTIQDIHERKMTEIKYELERMKSIQNSKLASLGELAAGIAHEINNPLSIIYGSAQLMSKYLDNPIKLGEKIEEINKSCNRISRIVNSLKKFSRTGGERQLSSHALEDIVKESLILTSAKANREHCQVTVDCESEGVILCDEIEIEQVIVNLINNAIDAVSEKTEKWVHLAIVEQAEKVRLTITDSGPGIDEDVVTKLFDPFFTTKAIGEGTGLGLSVSKGILDEHNANIFVDVTAKNTCFVIEFTRAC